LTGEIIGDWNILSQRLSGLVDQFIMRNSDQSPPPDNSVAQQVAEQLKWPSHSCVIY
jgi:hypothetical protein